MIIDLSLVLESAGMRAILGQRVDYLKVSVAGLAAMTAWFVQLHVLVGAVVGASVGLRRGGVERGMERGAVRGLRIGLMLASVLAGMIVCVLIYAIGFGFK